MKTKEFTFPEYMALAVGAWLIGCFGGWGMRGKSAERAAVKAGHAEYYLDDKNDRQWRWKPLPAEKPPTEIPNGG